MITTEKDLISFFNLCKNFHEETLQETEDINYTKLAYLIAQAQQMPDKFFVDMKRDEDNEIVGIFIGYVQELFYSSFVEGLELVFYLRKDHRGSPWFVKAMKRFEAWCVERGATSIRLLPSSGVVSNTSLTMYERLGYIPIGHIVKKDL